MHKCRCMQAFERQDSPAREEGRLTAQAGAGLWSSALQTQQPWQRPAAAAASLCVCPSGIATCLLRWGWLAGSVEAHQALPYSTIQAHTQAQSTHARTHAHAHTKRVPRDATCVRHQVPGHSAGHTVPSPLTWDCEHASTKSSTHTLPPCTEQHSAHQGQRGRLTRDSCAICALPLRTGKARGNF